MHIDDDEHIYRLDQVFVGDESGNIQFPWSAKVRDQVFCLGMFVVFVPLAYWAVYGALAWAPFHMRAAAAILVGVVPAVVLSVLATRTYSRYDRPETRIDYWIEQAAALMRAPRPNGDPVDVTIDLTRPARALPRGYRVWTQKTPETVCDKFTDRHGPDIVNPGDARGWFTHHRR